MRRLALACCCTAALAACTKPKPPAADSTASPATATATATQQAAPAALTPADFAGKWNGTSRPVSGPDTMTTHWVLSATADTTGWTLSYPKGQPIPVHPTIAGDSVVLDMGPYDNPRRKGTKVTVHSVGRLEGGKFVGRTLAHVPTAHGDSVVEIHSEATKQP